MAAEQVDALVIFGATGDLAKLETFPALVGLVQRGVLNVPVIGVAKNGWGLDQFRDYAVASLKRNNIDPASDPAKKMLGLLKYVDGDLDDDATYHAMSDAVGDGQQILFYLEVPPLLFGRIAQGIATAGRAKGNRIMVEKPFGTDLDSAIRARTTLMHQFFPERRDLPGGPLARPGAGGEPAVRPVRQLGHRAAAEPRPRGEHPDHHGRGVRRRRPGPVLRPDRRDPGCACRTTCSRCWPRVLADPPDGNGLDSWRDSKSRLHRRVAPADTEDTVRGQYEGYLDVTGWPRARTTETYVAVRLAVRVAGAGPGCRC